jgi:hypothetical protein
LQDKKISPDLNLKSFFYSRYFFSFFSLPSSVIIFSFSIYTQNSQRPSLVI